jgi:hypothetical protein
MIINRRAEIRCKEISFLSEIPDCRRFQILKIYYDLVIDVMLWAWKMPATLWYYRPWFS